MLARWNPFNELVKFDRTFDDLFGSVSWKPAVDVFEDKEKITVEAEIPGMDPKDVDISIDKNVLIIKGEKVLEEEKKKKDYFRTERSVGSFVRSFTLPSSVDAEKISASYDKGILTVLVPKKPEKVPRRIEIKGAG
jgi:HSP20 family protein